MALRKPSTSKGWEAAIAWAKSRRVALPEDYYGSIPEEARQYAFTVSDIESLHVIKQIQNSLTAALTRGMTMEEWKAELPDAAFDLPPGRLETVYRNAMQTAYNAGRYRQQQLNKVRRPILQYKTQNDERVRENHMAMHDFMAPVDDPVWATWYPPNGHNCRCYVISLTEDQAAGRGWRGFTPTPTAQPDPGWGGSVVDMARGARDARARDMASASPMLGARELAKRMVKRMGRKDMGRAYGFGAEFKKDLEGWRKMVGLEYGGSPVVNSDFKAAMTSAVRSWPEKAQALVLGRNPTAYINLWNNMTEATGRDVTDPSVPRANIARADFDDREYKHLAGLAVQQTANVADSRVNMHTDKLTLLSQHEAQSVLAHEVGHVWHRTVRDYQPALQEKMRAAWAADWTLNPDSIVNSVARYFTTQDTRGFNESVAELFAYAVTPTRNKYTDQEISRNMPMLAAIIREQFR